MIFVAREPRRLTSEGLHHSREQGMGELGWDGRGGRGFGRMTRQTGLQEKDPRALSAVAKGGEKGQIEPGIDPPHIGEV